MASNASRLVLGGFYDTILVRYVGEIGIKSEKVRRRLKDRLANCIVNQLERKHTRGFSLSITHARLFLSIKDPANIESVHEILQRIPGIHSFSYCTVIPIVIDKIHERAVSLARILMREDMSFAVRVTREGTHEFTSQSLARDVGSSIFEALKEIRPRVNLTSPDVFIHIEARDNTALFYHEKYDGFGGMPRDESSPVLGCVGLAPASWDACQRVVKRGSNLHPVILRRMLPVDVSAPEPSSVDTLTLVLNADSDLIGLIFQLLDMQEDNKVRVTLIKLSNEIIDFLEKEQVPIDSRAAGAFLGIAVPALIHARIYAMDGDAPRKSIDFKAIVSEYSGGSAIGCSDNDLRWIQAVNTAVARMMPTGTPALPVLFPLMPSAIVEGCRTPNTAGGAAINLSDDPLLVLFGQSTKMEAMVAMLQRAVDQWRVVHFDMIERRFLSSG